MPVSRFIVPAMALHACLTGAILKVDFGQQTASHRLTRRAAGVVAITARQNPYYVLGGSYFTNITIGTPPQTIEVQLDTGSPDLGINTPRGCSNSTCVGGTFDPSKSSSYHVTYPDMFSIAYVNNEYLIGDFGTDDVSIGDANLANMTIGVSMNSTLPFSIMGLSPTGIVSNESISTIQDDLFTTLQSLVSSESIKSRLFSVWLDDPSAATGSFLFGGIDESKFDQSIGLIELDMLKDEGSDRYERYQVPMTQMSLQAGDQTVNLTLPASKSSGESSWLPVTIDTGSPVFSLPQDIFDQLDKYVGTITDPAYPGLHGLPCAQAKNPSLLSSSINWTLGDPKNSSVSTSFEMAVSDLVIPVYVPGTTTPLSIKANGTSIDVCAFGVQPYSGEGTYLMGDPFIRAMYVVFDPDSGKMAFGQPISNPSKSSPVVVSKQIPDVTKSQQSGGTATASNTAATQSQTSSSGIQYLPLGPSFGLVLLVGAFLI